ncbi:hypothetical protein C8J56DRAFT_1083823 [Mycena floridula]|nr:hypothetical protein C8J56DRAFT_1083823 [Mycena floridula]
MERNIHQNIDATLLQSKVLGLAPSVSYARHIYTGNSILLDNTIETGWVENGYGGHRYVEHGKIEEEAEAGEPLPASAVFILEDSLPTSATPPPGPRLCIFDLSPDRTLRIQEQAMVEEMLRITSEEIDDLPWDDLATTFRFRDLFFLLHLVGLALSELSDCFHKFHLHKDASHLATDEWNDDYHNYLISLQKTLQRLRAVIKGLPAHPASERALSKLKQHYKKLLDLSNRFNRTFDHLRLSYQDALMPEL